VSLSERRGLSFALQIAITLFLSSLFFGAANAFEPPLGMVERLTIGLSFAQKPAAKSTDEVQRIDAGNGITLLVPSNCCVFLDSTDTTRIFVGARNLDPYTVSVSAWDGSWIVLLEANTYSGLVPDIPRKVGPFVEGTAPRFVNLEQESTFTNMVRQGYRWFSEYTEAETVSQHKFISHVVVKAGQGRALRTELITPASAYPEALEQYAQLLSNLSLRSLTWYESLWLKILQAPLLFLVWAGITIYAFIRAMRALGIPVSKWIGQEPESLDPVEFFSQQRTIEYPVRPTDEPIVVERIYKYRQPLSPKTNIDSSHILTRYSVGNLDEVEKKLTLHLHSEGRKSYGRINLPKRNPGEILEQEQAKILYLGLGKTAIHTVNRAMRIDMPGVDYMVIGREESGNVMDLSPAYLKLRVPYPTSEQVDGLETVGDEALDALIVEAMRGYKLVVIVTDNADSHGRAYLPKLVYLAKQNRILVTVMLTMAIANTQSLMMEFPALLRYLRHTETTYTCFTGPVMKRIFGNILSSKELQVVRMSWINLAVWIISQLAKDEVSFQRLKRRIQLGHENYFAFKQIDTTKENSESVWRNIAQSLIDGPLFADTSGRNLNSLVLAVTGKPLRENEISLQEIKTIIPRNIKTVEAREIVEPALGHSRYLVLWSAAI